MLFDNDPQLGKQRTVDVGKEEQESERLCEVAESFSVAEVECISTSWSS